MVRETILPALINNPEASVLLLTKLSVISHEDSECFSTGLLSDATFDKTAVFLSLNNWLGNQCTATRLTRELNRSVLSVIRSAPSLLGMTDGTYKYFVL